MKTILLLRHAKSAWNTPAQSDHDRPLNRRGERAAKAMAEHLAAKSPQPDLILCSTAIRARQTLAPLVALLPLTPSISFEEGLYLASEDLLMARMRALAEDDTTVLLIGHNDGIWHFATALAGSGPEALLTSLKEKYPTGTLATLRSPVARWRDLTDGAAELAGLLRPRDVMGA